MYLWNCLVNYARKFTGSLQKMAKMNLNYIEIVPYLSLISLKHLRYV